MDRAWTTDANGQPRMAFVAGDGIKLWLQLTNGGSSPANAEVAWEVVGHGGYFVEALSWTGTLSVPPGSTAFNIERTVPADAPWGAYTFMGSMTSNPIASASAELYLAISLRLADDFSNPASGWPSTDIANYACGYLNGEYRIWIKTANWAVWVAGPNTRLGDFVVEADARRVANTDDAYGLLFGVSDDGSRYNAFFVSRDGYFLITRYTTGIGWQDLMSWTYSSALNTGVTPNHLMVVRRGTEITGYANGQHLATVADTQLPSAGWQGFSVTTWEANADVRFDNFRMYSLGSAGLTGKAELAAGTVQPGNAGASEPPPRERP